jgi:hypothetical protein
VQRSPTGLHGGYIQYIHSWVLSENAPQRASRQVPCTVGVRIASSTPIIDGNDRDFRSSPPLLLCLCECRNFRLWASRAHTPTISLTTASPSHHHTPRSLEQISPLRSHTWSASHRTVLYRPF